MKEFLDRLRNNHEDFNEGSLEDQLKNTNPNELFKKWYEEAYTAECPHPNAMVVSTSDINNRPSSRIVYLKELVDEGLVFYTNYESKKGRNIEENNQVAVLFFWEKLMRQIRIEGVVEKAPDAWADDYFASRPRESQLGAWASKQSEKIENREELNVHLDEVIKRFEGKDVPRPTYWGGYLIRPLVFEFWQGRPNRLHDRICFMRTDIQSQKWVVNRLNP